MANYGIQFKDNAGNNYYPCPFPVGFVVLTTTKVNPQTYWGGTWVQYYGGYIYAAQSSIGQTSYTGWGTQGHSLTTAQMPSHSHTGSTGGAGGHSHTVQTFPWSGSNASYYVISASGPGGNVGSTNWTGGYTNTVGDHTHSVSIGSTGSGNSHSHNIATVDVFAWKRTA